MTNHEAIETLKANYPDACFEQLREAVDTAIFALQRSTHKALDTISRQDAIDVVKHAWAKGLEPTQYIEELPSAQPEIIRCKDCKHWDGVDTCDVIDAPVWDNDFCSMAERRSDE